jgi:hypothetical protein
MPFGTFSPSSLFGENVPKGMFSLQVRVHCTFNTSLEYEEMPHFASSGRKVVELFLLL